MPKRIQHLDRYLTDWPFVPGQVMVREVKGSDGRPLLQLRVDMGIVQLEVTGRPDGEKPDGFDTFYDSLLSQSFADGPAFRLDYESCREIDREFYQFYHRRICWLTINRYNEAIIDANHTLALMDFSTANSPDPHWTIMHEQYRPFVMFHKIQALTLIQLEKSNHRGAVEAVDEGLAAMQKLFDEHSSEEASDEDTLLEKLRDMKASIAKHYSVGPSLAEQLAQAIASEQYELAAKIRDRLDKGHQK